MSDENVTLPIEQTADGDSVRIEVVGGPKPYLWIGNSAGFLAAVDLTKRAERALCDLPGAKP